MNYSAISLDHFAPVDISGDTAWVIEQFVPAARESLIEAYRSGRELPRDYAEEGPINQLFADAAKPDPDHAELGRRLVSLSLSALHEFIRQNLDDEAEKLRDRAIEAADDYLEDAP